MGRFGEVLSEDPKDLEGAYEWSRRELERIEREEEALKELRIEMRPAIERAVEIRNRRLAREAGDSIALENGQTVRN